MAIYDGVIFFNELDLLELRLRELGKERDGVVWPDLAGGEVTACVWES
jgi:hypothetical protein